jgi:hypothetical protein
MVASTHLCGESASPPRDGDDRVARARDDVAIDGGDEATRRWWQAVAISALR